VSGLINAAAAASGNPVVLAGPGVLLDGTILIANAGRDGITGPTSVNIYGVAYGNKAKNAATTIGMGTYTTIAGMT
jgi:hypothetical protein